MSKLLEKERGSAPAEAWDALVFAFKNQKTIFVSQFWPIVLAVIACAILAAGMYLTAMPETKMQQINSVEPAVSAPVENNGAPGGEMTADVPMSGDEAGMNAVADDRTSTQQNVLGIPGTGLGFKVDLTAILDRLTKILVVCLLIFLGANLMSTVRFYRYMVLGEGQDEIKIPKLTFGNKEFCVLGYSFLISLIIAIALAIFAIPFAAILGAVGVILAIWAPPLLVLVVMFLYVLISIPVLFFVARFMLIFPAASCGHETSLMKSANQMKGQYLSFVCAYVMLSLIVILLTGVLVVLPMFGIYAIGSEWEVVFDVLANKFFMIFTGVMLTALAFWASFIISAAQAALISRYYHFALSKTEKQK